MDELECKAFFYHLLGERTVRRKLLKLWHSEYPVPKDERSLGEVFRNFLKTLLYAPFLFKITKRYICVFAEAHTTGLRIQRRWLSPSANAQLEGLRPLFGTCRSYPTGDYVWEKFPHDGDATIIDQVWRNQLCRDFVLLVCGKAPGDFVYLSVIEATQMLLYQDGQCDWFLISLHEALQTNTLSTLACWGEHPGDYHPDEIENNKRCV